MAELRNLDDLANYALAQVDRLRRAQEQLEEISAVGRSQDGLVVARTGAGGRLIELHVANAALRRGADRLSASVTAAVTAAQAAYAQVADDIMSGELGMRPTEGGGDYDRGLARIDELTDQLEDLVRRLDD
ncbi:MAG: YbaB/EbfC family nucleoid-associated protein [Hamadaea sp.]|nr:YbaB/EbfC family nucleoid-associated protein [Hamadaea sp.]